MTSNHKPQPLCIYCGKDAVHCVECEEIVCLDENCEGSEGGHTCEPQTTRYADELPERDYYEGDSPDW